MKLLITFIITVIIGVSFSGCTIVGARFYNRDGHRGGGITISTKKPKSVIINPAPPPSRPRFSISFGSRPQRRR